MRVLREHVLRVLPPCDSLLDVGCGDGRLARAVLESRAGLQVQGIDVHLRPDAEIPVTSFDGVRIPFPANSFDAVMFIDVLHHTTDPMSLLLEAKRVAKRCVIIKDHLCESRLDFNILRFMDWTGNARHGVALPNNYLSRRQWLNTFSSLDMRIDSWDTALGLYPWPASAIFGRQLHLVVRLSCE